MASSRAGSVACLLVLDGSEVAVATTTSDRVAQDIRERAEQLRGELAERERVFRAEAQRMRDELARLDGALRAMGGAPVVLGGGDERPSVFPRGQSKARILGVVGERAGVSAAEVAQATGIASATVSSTLAKLASSGEVLREQLPGGRVDFRLPDRRSGEGQ